MRERGRSLGAAQRQPERGAVPLLGAGAEAQVRARRRNGRFFRALTLAPVILAALLVLALVGDLVVSSVSWQVVEPAGSGRSFAWWQAPLGGDRVVRLELAAEGKTDEQTAALFADAEALRVFRARHRVDFMFRTPEGPWRWVLTSSRDDSVRSYGLFEGFARRAEIQASLTPGQRLYLNPWFDLSFFRNNGSRTPLMAGISTAMVGSLWVVGLVVLLALPVGVGTAVYLEEYAPDNRWTRWVDLNIRNLAGVPSIVYGILGLTVFVRLARLGPTVLAAGLTLSLLVLPVVVIAAREAVRSVPDSLRQASYGLGATKWQTVRRVVLPGAIPGIVTGVILSVARAAGETAPLLLVGATAFVPFMPDGIVSRYTVLPIQIYSWVTENDPEFHHVASAAILALLLVLAVLHGLAYWLRRRFERTW
ncbi:MAG TPA: phosphate ABC transporter permease PstA [Trueperaceae bacterium]